MNVESLGLFDQDAKRVVCLSGNVGRKVTRVIDKYFKDGNHAKFTIGANGTSKLVFAYDLGQIIRGMNLAQLEMNRLKADIKFSMSGVDAEKGVAILDIHAWSIPESMKLRQKFLNDMSIGVARITVMAILSDIKTEEDVLDEIFAGTIDGELTIGEHKHYKDEFNALVAGNVTNVLTAPMAIVFLAQLVNPVVGEAIDAEENKALTLEPAKDIPKSSNSEQYWAEQKLGHQAV